MTTVTVIVVFTYTWLFANADSKCPQLLACMNANSPDLKCSSYGAYFTCVSALSGTCDVDESKVTFKALIQPAKDFCNAFTTHSSEFNSCPSYGKCLEQTTMGQILNSSAQFQEDIFGPLLKSSTFCGLMEDMATCVVNETQAGRCSFSNEFLNTAKQSKQNIADICEGKGTGTGGNLLINAALILTGAAIAIFRK